tara:strand:+ start:944 stop:1198 length:255 start_codon:yes stop_codon:yes gene_type:complete
MWSSLKVYTYYLIGEGESQGLFVRRMSKDLEIPGKEGARVVFAHFHPAHKMYMSKSNAMAHIGDFYDQPDSSLWNTNTAALKSY